MKKIFSKICSLAATCFMAAINYAAPRKEFVPRMSLKQGGFVLLGTRGYAGYAPGTVVELPASTEATLIAAGQATASAGPPTPGSVTTTMGSGCLAITAGAQLITVTNPAIGPQSLVWAQIASAAIDGTLTSIARVVPAVGSVTIVGNANATGTVLVDWCILNPTGSLTNPT